ncbi:hypothetical protein KBB96_05255 [Luteolibacter ambystomatis]|uniref:Uncharacterized protein n=1 Tax=Luteolibacter ambystomatis TaxID=2824561 RepID=A0A975PFX5_9BACT|nr:hypothetical protein [Luteolibacter ambystomatis]QUE52299.1 hypothetical protein KBB96_05255 [Luteolibacter ambystomatis]
MATSSDANQTHWLNLADKTSRRVNFGWWLDRLAAPLVIAAIAGACGLLLVRREHPETPLGWLAGGIVGGLAIIGLVAWLMSRTSFETSDQSLVRLEAAMRLRNALSAARAGVAPWPNPPAAVDAGIEWNWPRLLVPILGTLLLLAAGLLIPVSKPEAAKHPTEAPQAWSKIESDLNKLADEKMVDETYLEDMRKRLDELRAQKEEDWFSHSSLEATDSLKKAHQSEISRVERELGRAEKAMNDLQKTAAAGGQAEQARLANEFDQALQGLKNGAMKPNPELLKQLQNFDPKNLGGLTKEQMQQLKENLQKAANGMKDMQGQGGQGQGDDWADQLLSGEGDGQGNGQGQGNGGGEGEGENGEGEGVGKGGVSRGPGHSNNLFGKEHEKRQTGDLTGLENKDLSRATPGDLLQLQDGEHDVDKSGSKVTGGGATDSTGAGGDRVWKESLDPSEQRAMKNFFSEGKK